MQYSILELRSRRRLKQKEVAEDLGVAHQTYCAWEKDLSGVSVGKVLRVAQYFGVTLNDINISPKNFKHEHEFNSCDQSKDSA